MGGAILKATSGYSQLGLGIVSDVIALLVLLCYYFHPLFIFIILSIARFTEDLVLPVQNPTLSD